MINFEYNPQEYGYCFCSHERQFMDWMEIIQICVQQITVSDDSDRYLIETATISLLFTSLRVKLDSFRTSMNK
jgi:hypothetical protein